MLPNKICAYILVAVSDGLSYAAPDGSLAYHEPRPYDFAYVVKDELSGNDFGHSEQSDGAAVNGEYYVLLPDGRRQTVTYTADHHTGYVANVQYEGEARFDGPRQQQYPLQY
ncbi:Cuticle Protein CPR RR-2 [Hyalella azteca]|uniref:Cuticle Protein CPR RR-2 n=1 Tax=Hyalella azteca TaxID=294128 RepID=A0A6A0H8P6_HYAAZ|nr:pro-resilin [Hyalella azteca]KAA0201601.1 Cuticle Protein CPR RR-2 [Hyalella azteca]